MSKKLSPGAANLLQIINRAPGHSRDELMKLAGISRRVWSNLSGELKAAGKVRAESVQVNGKMVYKWYTKENHPKQPASKAKSVAKTPKTKAKRGRPQKSTRATAKVREHIRRGTRTPSSSWSTKEVRILTKLWKEGKSDEEIQAVFNEDAHCGNRSISAINKKRSAEGLVFRNRSTKAKTPKATKKEAKIIETKHEPVQLLQGNNTQALLMLKEALSLLMPTEKQNLAEYAKHMDVKDSFDKVTLALDTLNERLKVIEEVVAGMQDTQSMVDDKQNQVLHDLLAKMSDFTNEIQDKINDN